MRFKVWIQPKKIVLRAAQSLFLLCLVVLQATAQQSISTDRPSIGFSSYIVPKGTLTGELGYLYTVDKEGDVSLAQGALPRTTFRYGLTDGFELRAQLAQQFLRFKAPGTNVKENTLSPLNLGFKLRLYEKQTEDGNPSFRVSALTLVGLPFTVKESLRPDEASLFGLVILEKMFANASVYTNIGGTLNGELWTWTINAGYNRSLNTQLGTFIEVYSSYQGDADVLNYGIDGGFTYALSRKYQVDLAAGYGLGEFGPDFLLNAGFSFLID